MSDPLAASYPLSTGAWGVLISNIHGHKGDGHLVPFEVSVQVTTAREIAAQIRGTLILFPKLGDEHQAWLRGGRDIQLKFEAIPWVIVMKPWQAEKLADQLTDAIKAADKKNGTRPLFSGAAGKRS